MKVEFKRSFERDLRKIKDKTVRQQVQKIM